MSKWKVGVVLGMLGLYLLGIWSGVALVRLRQHRRWAAIVQKLPSPVLRERFLMRALIHSLNLSKAQRAQIRPLARRLIEQRTPHVRDFQRKTYRGRVAFLKAIRTFMKPRQQKVWQRLYNNFGKAPTPAKKP